MSDLYRTNFGMIYGKDDIAKMTNAGRISTQIFNSFLSQRLRIPKLTMALDTIELAKMVKLDQEDTWNYIRNSPYVYGQNLAFIEDTIDFIYSNRRNVSIDNWIPLVNVDDSEKYSLKKKNIKYRKLPEIDNKNVLLLWIRKPNGLMDMITTLYLILLQTKND